MKSNRTRNFLIGGAAVLAVVAGGGAYAIANSADGSDDKDVPVAKADANKAERAATAEVNGRVLYVEYEEDYGGGYEVEVQKKDGSEVEVYLDKSFKVASVDSDHSDEAGGMGGHSEYGTKGMDSGQGKQGTGAKQ